MVLDAVRTLFDAIETLFDAIETLVRRYLAVLSVVEMLLDAIEHY